MADRYLVILEVSQKQSFIFGHKKLQNNIIASDTIRYVTSPVFFGEIVPELFDEEKNLVYDGGGHTILEFASEEEAKKFVSCVTEKVLREFMDLELFAKVEAYQDELSPAENEKWLIQKLEEKKSLRRSVFHQGSLGVEASARELKKSEEEQIETERRKKIEKVSLPTCIDTKKYRAADAFENLGGKKNDSNFIAVVHIDGNLMGKRVGALQKDGIISPSCSWEEYKDIKRTFSEEIDRDFKEAFSDMIAGVEKEMEESLPEKLDLGRLQKPYFPVRRIITAGDDVCFVTEGRIGLECARLFLESIYKKENKIDHKNYSACAGVAIVHQKYPFYRAYELAEALCSNAKKYIASLAEDEPGEKQGVADVCAIDWHIEFGEMMNGLGEIRRQYRNEDGYHLETRPYIICGDEHLTKKDPLREYNKFRELCADMIRGAEVAGRSKLKQLRSMMKKSEKEAKMYVQFQHMEDTAFHVNDIYEGRGKELFAKMYDGENHGLIFDALEMVDTFIPLGGQL